MRPAIISPRSVLCVLLILAGASANAYTAEIQDKERHGGPTACEMRFNLKGMSTFHETARGEGIILCNKGQRATFSVKATGGGLMFGMSEVVDGTGKFSDARTIDELFGSYVQAEVHAGNGGLAAIQVLTKGRISLVLAGSDRGVDFGFAFEKFTIERTD